MGDAANGPDLTAAVDAAFGEVRRLRAWLAFPLPVDLRAELEQRRVKAESDLVGMLLAWQDIGGGLALDPPVGGVFSSTMGESPVEIGGSSGGRVEPYPSDPNEADAKEVELEEVESEAGKYLANPLDVVAPVVPVIPENKRPAQPIIQSPAVDVWAAERLKAAWETGAGAERPEPAVVAQKFNFKQALAFARTPGFEAAMALSATHAQWSRLPQQQQNLLLELSAARLRIVQPEHERQVVARIQQLSRWSTETRTGLVNGLNRGATPLDKSWAIDAAKLVKRLADLVAESDHVVPRPGKQGDQLRIRGIESLLAGYIAAVESADEPAADEAEANLLGAIKQAYASGTQRKHPKLVHLFRPHPFLLGGSDFKDLRRAIRDLDEKDDDKASPAGNRLEPNWPLFHLTRGKRGLLVGGDPRDDRRERLKQVFQFASLEWAQTEFSRTSLQSARTRVESGGVDVVMVLHRWCGHDVDKIIQPACKKHGVAFVPVQQSYGITGIRMAFERFGESSAVRAEAAK